MDGIFAALRKHMKGLKSPAEKGEGNVVYGKVSLDREGITLADQLHRQTFPDT
jgi:hypothetical protein